MWAKYMKIHRQEAVLHPDDFIYIIIENAHTPIIDARTFAYTQEQLKLRSRSNYRGEKKYATDYSGFLC